MVYLITCKKCGIQYVGEISQKLRSRFNNHRNRLKKLTNLYLYHHFSSDGLSVEDMSIMPIEESMIGLELHLKDLKERSTGVGNLYLLSVWPE